MNGQEGELALMYTYTHTLLVANAWVDTGICSGCWTEWENVRTRPDQVACAIYAIIYRQCDIDECHDHCVTEEIVGGMELGSSQVAEMFQILEKMFSTSPSEMVGYGMAGLRGSPKLTAEDVPKVKFHVRWDQPRGVLTLRRIPALRLCAAHGSLPDTGHKARMPFVKCSWQLVA